MCVCTNLKLEVMTRRQIRCLEDEVHISRDILGVIASTYINNDCTARLTGHQHPPAFHSLTLPNKSD